MFLAAEPRPRPIGRSEKRNIITLFNNPVVRFFRRLETSLGIPPESYSLDGSVPTKSSPEELARYLMLSPTTGHAIRLAEEFSCEHLDGPLRVLALIDHLFIRYPVPLCLYRTMLSAEGLKLVFPNDNHPPGRKKRMLREAHHRKWFHAVARGESFADVAKPVLSRREAHWFLQSPNRYSIKEAIVWAKAAALGLPAEGCDMLLDRFRMPMLRALGDRLEELMQFYARAWDAIEPAERIEIADYLMAAFADPSFSLAGRTAGSVRKLSHDWHRRRTAARVGRTFSWKGAIAEWEQLDGSYRVRLSELTSNVLLAEEGGFQGHCVLGYASTCASGACRIVSMRWSLNLGEAPGLETARLTMEIRTGKWEIVQIRGKFNRSATPEELKVIRRWAVECGLTVAPYA